MKMERYEGINGLRAYAIIGIVIMHVLANGKYELGGFVFEKMIPSFANLVFLFMMVSAFGMCCGYYQRVINREISVEEFYIKRFTKIWPYFALLCVIDLIVSPSKNSLYEVFANLTLCQGLIPNANISVIGVSWTLAIIFCFYMLFPFFCFLIGNQKRAWLSFGVTLVFNYLCSIYFIVGRKDFIYDAVYFMAGGLIFLYREKITSYLRQYKLMSTAGLLIVTVFYYIVGGSTIATLLFCSVALMCALVCKNGGVLVNSIAKFVGNISFEIYLCHMLIYRILEKLQLNHVFESDLLSFMFTACITICGSIVFSLSARWILNAIKFLYEREKKDV